MRAVSITRIASLLALGAAVAAAAGSAEELRNWFDDPFFQVSSSVADCPVPAAPARRAAAAPAR